MSIDEPILIAEDDEADVFLLRRAMERAGVHVPAAFVRDGLEAVEYLRKRTEPPACGNPPELMVLDIKLPRMDGFEVLEYLQAEPALRPRHVIILSSSEQPQDVRRAAALGVEHYLVKPTDSKELVGIVNRLADYWQQDSAMVSHRS